MTDEFGEQQFGGGRQPVETVADIAPNRTLIAGRFTATVPVKPAVVQGLQQLEMVFAHYQPEVTVVLEEADGSRIQETLHLRALEDFAPDMAGLQSRVLKRGTFQTEEYLEAARMLQTNEPLKQALGAAATRSELQATIKKMIAALEPYL
ncbi:hypothetical protein [Niabella aurantiaca]|uniref:hypothetical protein n=1 Tax=Niabella aurantiaca TaxID=379900 RepID=UPI00037B1134|nr:hypothetical protein [Niabella aurantiaca]